MEASGQMGMAGGCGRWALGGFCSVGTIPSYANRKHLPRWSICVHGATFTITTFQPLQRVISNKLSVHTSTHTLQRPGIGPMQSCRLTTHAVCVSMQVYIYKLCLTDHTLNQTAKMKHSCTCRGAVTPPYWPETTDGLPSQFSGVTAAPPSGCLALLQYRRLAWGSTTSSDSECRHVSP